MKLILAVTCLLLATMVLVDGRSIVKRRFARQAPPSNSSYPPFTTATSSPSNNNTDPCIMNPCMNGGSCYSSGGYTGCTCPGGWYGQYCEYYWSETTTSSSLNNSTDVCSMNPCMNGGSCIFSGGFPVCLCPNGWHGQYCENHWSETTTWSPTTPSADPCASHPCRNGGSCVPLFTYPGSYLCNCLNGYSGKDCSEMNNNNHNDSSSSLGGIKLNFFLSLLTTVNQK